MSDTVPSSPPGSRLRELLDNPPALHGGITYALVGEALQWINALPDGLRTLETGCGLSTLVFVLRGDEHVCITPSPAEPAAVRAYCQEHGLGTDRLSFHVERSEFVLPKLHPEPRDLVLIDGSHAFPQVFVDYMYTAPMLAAGGTLIVDDVHLWTGKVLRDFLTSEPEWRLVAEWDGRTVAFEKRGEPPARDWYEQAFVMRRSSPWIARGRMAASMLRRGDLDTLRSYASGMLGRR